MPLNASRRTSLPRELFYPQSDERLLRFALARLAGNLVQVVARSGLLSI